MRKSGEIDLKDFWLVIKRQKRVILYTLLACIVIALGVDFLMPPVYEATIQILIQKEPDRSPLTGAVIDSSNQQSDHWALDTAVGLITNQTILERIAAQFKEYLQPSWFSKLFNRLTDTLGNFLPQSGIPVISKEEREQANRITRLETEIISVAPVENSRLVNINVHHQDPVAAKNIANTLAQLFVEYQARQRAEENKNLTVYLDGQLSDVKKRVEESENAFYAFKDREGLFSLEGKLKEQSENIADLNSSYVKTKTERLAIEARLNKLKEIIEKEKMEEWGQLPVQSEALDALRRELLLAQTELAKAKEVYKSQHPKLKTLQSAILSIQNNILNELGDAISRLKAEHAILLSREEQVRSAITQAEREMHQINKKYLQYTILERELNTNQDLYNLVLAKLKQTDISGKIQTPIIQIVEPAAMPIIPIRPSKVLNLVISLVVGPMIGVGLAFFREYLGQTIRTPQDVKEQLKLPVLGMIPKGA